jgi:hypothetical protein
MRIAVVIDRGSRIGVGGLGFDRSPGGGRDADHAREALYMAFMAIAMFEVVSIFVRRGA